MGSFCNVLIDRLPHGEDVLVSRSHCDYCKKTLSWYELIPLFSFLLLRGRCNHCHKKLSFQYPLIELIVGIGFVMIGWNTLALILFSTSVVIIVTDYKYFIIPDVVLFLMGLVGIVLYPNIYHVVSALAAYSLFYVLFRVTKEKGMGFGDVKLSGVLGLLLGFPKIVIALYVAFLTGALVGVILLLVGKAKMKTKVPFGPFLILGALVSLLWGDLLYQWWLTML